MALGDNAILPLFTPADDVSAAVTAAINSGVFVKIGATMQASPILDVSTPTSPLTKGNLMVVSACGAGERAIGVTKWDTAAADDVVGLFTGNQVVPMLSGAAITAGAKVMANASGLPITWTSAASEANNFLGIALNTVGAGAVTVWIKLVL
jgi:Uncharacterized conserved protein (DUF2190)